MYVNIRTYILIVGMPAGFTLISVGGYGIMGLTGISVVWIYLFVGIFSIINIGLWLRIPVPSSYNEQNFSSFIKHLREWKEWLPLIMLYSICLAIDMMLVSFFAAINQYLLTGDNLPLFGVNKNDIPNINASIKLNFFFSIFSICTFIGDAGGRKLMYYYKLNIHPGYYLILGFIGGFICCLQIPILNWIGIMLVFLCNGLVYAGATRKIDLTVNKSYSLTALSFWLFIGDCGSVTGSNIWELFVNIICKRNKNSQYFCAESTNPPTLSPTILPSFMISN